MTGRGRVGQSISTQGAASSCQQLPSNGAVAGQGPVHWDCHNLSVLQCNFRQPLSHLHLRWWDFDVGSCLPHLKVSMQHVDSIGFITWISPCGPGAIPPAPYLFTSALPTFCSSFCPFVMHLFSSISIPSNTTKIGPLRFQSGCRSRQLNLAVVFFVLIFYVT